MLFVLGMICWRGSVGLAQPAVSIADGLQRDVEPSPLGKVAERSEVG